MVAGMEIPNVAARDAERKRFLDERRQLMSYLLYVACFVTIAMSAMAVMAAKTWSASVALFGLFVVCAHAALAVGGLLGFLFGVPRGAAQRGQSTPASQTSPAIESGAAKDSSVNQPNQVTGSEFAPNTNLVEVSDWLTKMLVGVGLTQLTMVPSYVRRGAEWLATGVDPLTTFGRPFGAVSMAGTVIFYLAMGFIFGHLITQLWVFGAFTMAKRQADDAANAMRVLQEFRVSAPNLNVPRSEGAGEAAAIKPSSDLRRAAAEVLKRSESELNTASELAARGTALAIDEAYEAAAAYFERAAAKDPNRPEYLMDQARALTQANYFLRAITPLERAYELSKNDAGARERIALEIMFNGLYANDRKGFEKAIEYGEPLSESARSENISVINRFLACAYGQKYSYNKEIRKLSDDASDQVTLREATVKAINRDLNSLLARERTEERQFLAALLNPKPEEEDDDLKDFAKFPEFQKLLGER